MSLDTKLFISSKYSISEIQTVLARAFKTKTLCESTKFAPNYVLIHLEVEGEKRHISVFMDSEFKGFTGTLLSLNANGNAVLVMQTLAHVFGGFVQKFDNIENFDGYDGKLSAQDGIIFWARAAIVDGVDSNNENALLEYIKSKKASYSID